MNECANGKTNKGTIEERLERIETLAASVNLNVSLIYDFIPNKNTPKVCTGEEGCGLADEALTDGLEGRLDAIELTLVDAAARSRNTLNVFEVKFGSMTIE